jgi:hypothetical protein
MQNILNEFVLRSLAAQFVADPAFSSQPGCMVAQFRIQYM